MAEPIFVLGKARRRVVPLPVLRDQLKVFPDAVVIHRRGFRGGDSHIPVKSITEVSKSRRPALFNAYNWRLHLNVGGKKHVLRHLSQEEADEAAAAIAALLKAPN